MSVPSEVTALLCSLTRRQIDDLPPMQRQLLTDQCRRIVRLADESAATPPKSGVLAHLDKGERAQ